MEQQDFFNILEQTKPICPVCGNRFEKRGNYNIYCSNKCRGKASFKRNGKKEYQKNKQKYKERSREYYRKNKEKILEKRKDYLIEYRKNNKERKKYLDREYRKKNRKKINEYIRKKFKEDVEFKLLITLRNRLGRVIKTNKRNTTINLLGCSIIKARRHIEKQFKEGMSWENHGKDGWHIDHIIPCASFDLTDPKQQKKCFHYTNLQPLWWRENLSKGAKIL